MNKKHILITYANTGSGHKTPAEAVAAALEELFPGKYRISLCDFFVEAGESQFNDFICRGWDWLLAHPRVNFFNICLSYALSPYAHWFLPLLYSKAWKGGMEYLNKIKPDLVFSTHFYCQNTAIDARIHHNLSYPVITLNPDSFETFPQWDRRGDLLLVNSSLALKKAIRLGHRPERTLVVPQALRKDFDAPKIPDIKALRTRLGLPPENFTLFLSDGGQGIGAMKAVVEALAESGLSLNLICICGRNQGLREQLQKLRPKNLALKVFGYTDNMVELLSAADLFVGKGGPASVIEALKMQKPALITYAVNTAETNTRDFFVEQGMAWYCKNPRSVPRHIARILADPSLLRSAAAKVRSSSFFANGSPEIARIIQEVAEDPLSIPKITARP